MGAFGKLFGKIKVKKQLGGFFQLLDGYTPVFTTYDGGVYEMELTRACIHTFALHCSKLQPVINGADPYKLKGVLEWKVNPFHTCPQFLYKAATIYKTQNTCLIIPLYDSFGRISGYYPAGPNQTELREEGGKPYLVYTFGTGEKAAVELERVGFVSQYLYKNDLIGEDNSALDDTMKLLSTQSQGIAEGIKNSASFRFMATLKNFTLAKDLAKERKNWVADNLSADAGGLALFPNNYVDVKQIQSVAKIVDPEQMKMIENRVYTYFGSNEKILLNQASGDDWSAYYEGQLEPFALQLATAMTVMTYSHFERIRKNAILWTANRMQYMTNADKLQVSSQLFDRGILSINNVMDIWQLPHVEDGDKRYIRKEYIEISQLDEVAKLQSELKAAQAAANVKTEPEVGTEDQKKEEENDPEL